MKRIFLIGLCAAAYCVYDPMAMTAPLIVVFCCFIFVLWVFGKIAAQGNRDAARLGPSDGGASSTDNAIQRTLDEQARNRGESV